MITINTANLKTQLDNLNTAIEEYELTKMNLFNQLKNSSINWRDGRTNSFENKISEEKKETELLIQNLRKIYQVYEYIYNKYSTIGKKINCNYENKQSALYAFEDSANKINEIIAKYDSLSNSLSGLKYNSHVQNFINTKREIFNQRDTFNKIKLHIQNTFALVETTENEVKEKTSLIEDIKVNEFIPTLINDGSTDGKAMIQRELLAQNIEDMKLYIQQEREQLDKIANIMIACNNEYSSGNSLTLATIIEKTKITINSICDKRNLYVNVLTQIVEDYTSGKNVAVTVLDKHSVLKDGIWQNMIQ